MKGATTVTAFVTHPNGYAMQRVETQTGMPNDCFWHFRGIAERRPERIKQA